jgi:hypothetical protein
MRELVFMYLPGTVPGWINKWIPADYPQSIYDPDRQYNQNVVFYYDMYGPYQDTIVDKFKQGHKVIYDAKNEHYITPEKQWIIEEFKKYPGQGMFLISGHEAQSIPGITIQATPYWYWILDQVNFDHNDYKDYIPAPTNNYKFFMQLSQTRPDRDLLYEKFKPVLADSLHSYRGRGIFLSNDHNGIGGNWQRYMNFDWINQTCFTVSVETYMSDKSKNGHSLTTNDQWFLSEKSYKAIAAHHPFILASTPTNLSYLRSQGFETFPDLWDERYDNERNFERRVDMIIDIIKDFDRSTWNQNIVKEKLQHNRARFFDSELTKKFCWDTIVEPVLKFAQ